MRLIDVSYRVGSETWLHDVESLAATRRAQRAARRDARRQDHAAAPHGGSRSPASGRLSIGRSGRHRRVGAPAQRGDGVSAVHQLSLAEGIRKHRFAAAHREMEGQGNTRARRQRSPRRCGSRRSSTACPRSSPGGQQQRTALARALAKDAELLLLDEPLVNLDYKLREELRDELTDLFAQGRTTVVYATTEPQEALQLGGHTAVLARRTSAAVRTHRRCVSQTRDARGRARVQRSAVECDALARGSRSLPGPVDEGCNCPCRRMSAARAGAR